MQWWNDFWDWFTQPANRDVLYTAAVLFFGVLIAGIIAALVARSSTKRVVRMHDEERKAAAIAALVDAATEASVWNSLTPQEQVLADRAVGQADIIVRLLPIRGSDVAANWASHQLHELKRASATFGYQLDPAVVEFRDRLVEWQHHPGRMRRRFQLDLERWRLQRAEPETAQNAEQDQWVAEQHHERYAPVTQSDAVASQPTAVIER
ncbi:hypothetical protein [Agromyces seonyuensis]|uniref:Uncharacterized protein n=1 Tax=Agromyces seonyuensis TaxID=2662446 RepID=A0A6I4NSF4_9MICO|nr:hypothetical protein [Agromyces seonyuensis]MWB97376.1 hypothetical protein [Agromyces seonyuensis]